MRRGNRKWFGDGYCKNIQIGTCIATETDLKQINWLTYRLIHVAASSNNIWKYEKFDYVLITYFQHY